MPIDPATAQIAAAGITAASGLIGGAMGGGYSAGANKLNRKTMYRQHRLQMAASNTAVQRRMADLQAAGINPILAGKYDATTPAVTALQSHNPAIGAAAMAQAGAGVANSAIGASRTVAETDLIVQQTDTEFEKWLTQTHEADIKAVVSDYAQWLKQLEYEQQEISLDVMKENLKQAKRLGQIAESDFGLYMRYLGEFTGAIGNIFRGSATFHGNP